MKPLELPKENSMSRRDRSAHLPDWLWFFLILPLGLIVTLLWRRRSLPRPSVRPRYIEPDSIPIDTRTGYPSPVEEIPLAEAEGSIGTDAEDSAFSGMPGVVSAGEPQSEKAEDLKVIEGIGPAIERLLHNHGVTTFRNLADTPVERLDQILSEANLRRLADPGTWPEQASLAAARDWEGLARLQGTLKAGRRSAGE
jgi:predicted flap endonuclease-1-like 5' DNA nuclease